MNSKKSEILSPTKFSIEEQLHHQYMPFSSNPIYESNKRTSIATHLIDFALILAELQPVKEEQILLDIGAGGGWTSEWFNKCGIKAFPIDISPNWKEIYQKHQIDLTPYTICDAEYLTSKFEDEYTDFIVFYNSLHHMQNQKKIISECYKVLKKGGKIIFLEPGYTHTKKQNTKEAMKRFGMVERGIYPFKLKKDCKKAGFSNVYLKADYTVFPSLRNNTVNGTLLNSILFSSIYSLFSLKGRTFVVATK